MASGDEIPLPPPAAPPEALLAAGCEHVVEYDRASGMYLCIKCGAVTKQDSLDEEVEYLASGRMTFVSARASGAGFKFANKAPTGMRSGAKPGSELRFKKRRSEMYSLLHGLSGLLGLTHTVIRDTGRVVMAYMGDRVMTGLPLRAHTAGALHLVLKRHDLGWSMDRIAAAFELPVIRVRNSYLRIKATTPAEVSAASAYVKLAIATAVMEFTPSDRDKIDRYSVALIRALREHGVGMSHNPRTFAVAIVHYVARGLGLDHAFGKDSVRARVLDPLVSVRNFVLNLASLLPWASKINISTLDSHLAFILPHIDMLSRLFKATKGEDAMSTGPPVSLNDHNLYHKSADIRPIRDRAFERAERKRLVLRDIIARVRAAYAAAPPDIKARVAAARAAAALRPGDPGYNDRFAAIDALPGPADLGFTGDETHSIEIAQVVDSVLRGVPEHDIEHGYVGTATAHEDERTAAELAAIEADEAALDDEIDQYLVKPVDDLAGTRDVVAKAHKRANKRKHKRKRGVDSIDDTYGYSPLRSPASRAAKIAREVKERAEKAAELAALNERRRVRKAELAAAAKAAAAGKEGPKRKRVVVTRAPAPPETFEREETP